MNLREATAQGERISPLPRPPADNRLNFARRTADRISAQGIAALGLAGFFGAWILSDSMGGLSPRSSLILFAALTSLPMIIASLAYNKTHLRTTSGLVRCGNVNLQRSGIKLLGLAGTLLILAFFYWLFPEYRKEYYSVVWQTLPLIALPGLGICIAYFVYVDAHMAEPKDGYWHFGQLIVGKWQLVDWTAIREHFLGWTIKGFFLPFMLAGMAKHLEILVKEGWNPSSFETLYLTSFTAILAIDTTFGAIGYLLTLRILDSQIRSVQPTLFGWLVTLSCYAPFAQFLHEYFLSYTGRISWFDWLSNHPVSLISWGFAIILLQLIYVWATLSFGCRFSNLTNRGIIVDGPYRYLKHPAYVAKNLSWWLIAIPFVANTTWQENLRCCLLLLLTNAIYLARAKTEEAHLLQDSAYKAYSIWISKHGLYATLKSGLSRTLSPFRNPA